MMTKMMSDSKTLLFFLQWLMIFFLQASGRREWDGVVITEDDYQGLQAFKNELIDPKGYLKSWNGSGLGACSGGWIGIKCAKGQVIVIQLPWKGLGGRITEKISQFQSLRKLNLHDNLIGGMIPSSLGLLPYLRGLHLFNNRFFGSIPPSLGQCSLLQTLDLSNNSLSGTIPPSLGNSSKLYRVNLSYNSLVGPIPSELTRLNELIFIDLHYNNLSGTLPLNLAMLSNLMTLDLSHNSVNGTIPSSISRLYSLNILNLESNNLVGQLPQDIGNLHNLSVLNLRKNQINGFIPRWIGSISTLSVLDLSYNNLNGEIPDSLSHLSKLTSFNVSYNNLSKSVPITLSQKFNSSSFIGNLELCGFSLSTPCYIQSPSPQGGPTLEKLKTSRKLTVKDIILIAVAALLIVMFSLCCILWFLSRRSATRKPRVPPVEKGVPPTATEAEAGDGGGKLVHFDGPFVFTADDLLCATAEIMGKNTYGTSYKTTLEDGNQVAVKRMREKITKGQKEFVAEVHILAKIRHPNLLALRAYYLGPKGEKLLVFDYMPKGSLATFLHARHPGKQMNWGVRIRIIQGIATGLFHLHSNMNMIHGNLTSSNILIDDNNDPKISDYGLSRLTTTTPGSNIIATGGAVGYRAPELSKIKKNTTKTDVYSLGVIMLELLTGKSPEKSINGLDLPQWAASVVKEEWTNEVFDEELMKEASMVGDELLNVLKVALHCVDRLASLRPEVLQVLQQLDEIMPHYSSSED